MPACEMSAIVWWFEHSLALPFFGIGMETDFSRPVAAAEFPKCAGTLSAAVTCKHTRHAHQSSFYDCVILILYSVFLLKPYWFVYLS